jgi:hypothetical protein
MLDGRSSGPSGRRDACEGSSGIDPEPGSLAVTDVECACQTGEEADTVETGGDFTSRLMNDMDPALLDFVKSKVNSFIKWDLVRFFHENPHAADTAESIARYTGRHVDAVQPELEGLVSSGVMEQRAVDETTVYAITAEPGMRALIEKFVDACEDRHFRVKAVYHIIKSMR